MAKITTAEMECVLANWFGYRQNLIVPNVHWGLNMHECDLLILSKAGYVTECEIKISKSDLKKDAEKRHGHFCPDIKYLYFALPDYLADSIEYVPERAGILIVRTDPDNDGYRRPRVRRLRNTQPQKSAKKMTDDYRFKVARLGALRLWGLKRKITALQRQNSTGEPK